MERIGIIDIGSNSIRLVVYECTASGSYRVIDETKESARLSARLDKDGRFAEADLEYIADTLRRFQLLCEHHGVSRLRAVATAAVRNSPDPQGIARLLSERTSLPIEVLSGEEEARLGFLGMTNTMDVRDGFVIDIGGGSTELLLFRDRAVVRSVSFPFGAVNTMKRFGRGGDLDEAGARAIVDMVEKAAREEPWIASAPGLPLVGLGGTIRSLCKIDQRERKYSLPVTHRYQMTEQAVDGWLTRLRGAKLEQRKRIEGLSKDRADIIVPGLLILHTLFRQCRASHYVISGSGLRDGLFYEMYRPDAPQFGDVLEHSVHNLLGLHPSVSLKHVLQVERLAMKLFADLSGDHGYGGRVGLYLHVAALLYRIGISINYYNFHKHTYYLMAHSRVDGLSHREILICALIASFKNEKRLKPLFAAHRDLLTDADFSLIVRLGALLQIAVALDRSETQPIATISARSIDKTLRIEVKARRSWAIERRELDTLAKEFAKLWGLSLSVVEAPQ
ncbi:Ppx/GppA phosphatase family protein [Paenibacillus sp.]|uniref:Ppx/GppA phosphatase family protein n=1 Tax=Paenibacillus sp. TaxID=58172 RepID=UPI002D6F60DD|nr:Ppx/GppA phosphatase family protein [Paenibacillus sp.]HZG58438.1 Ppx/GppA phosphatase family protein [Paenibacillus sp.]